MTINRSSHTEGSPFRVERKDIPEFTPSMDTEEVFRNLITDELRSGRLTPARRRRSVQYATRLGLTAVRAGRLVKSCREEVLKSDDATERYYALRLIDPVSPVISARIKIALMITGAIIFDVLVIAWLF